ncbi:MAG: hypothetical protein IJ593_04790 [Lachnospiraceae bacterium]|nr:hypothetical protein [Lachnospiraceae bacterium]
MKIGKNPNKLTSSKPASNRIRQIALLILIVAITAALIVWVYVMGLKATETIDVVMTAQSIYKNQQITESMLQPYSMVKAEYEKYSITQENGTTKRRLITWDERGKLIGSFAAYPLQANITPDYRCFYFAKVDNSDSVLYNFPGKEIIALSIATGDLNTFKKYLQPGDRVTITATYTVDEKVETDSINKYETVSTFRSEIVFRDIVIADLLNNSGDSILDIYEDYNARSVGEQAALDASNTFQESVEPSSLLVALTPEEKAEYFYYLSKSGISFRMSLPQRVE